MKLSHKQKLEKYKKGEYQFKAPPVCTAFWDDDAWIKWIDACDGWINYNREADEISDEDLQAAGDYWDRLVKGGN